MLPFTFENSSDYDKISPSDRLSLRGLNDIAPGKVIHVLDHRFSTYTKFFEKLTFRKLSEKQRTFTYQEARSVSFSENLACVLIDPFFVMIFHNAH